MNGAVHGERLKTLSPSFLEGPEGVIVLGHPLGAGFIVSALGSFAHLFEENLGPAASQNTGEAKNLSYYGLSLGLPPVAGTTITVGLLGAILNGYQTGQKFHDVGPTLSISRSRPPLLKPALPGAPPHIPHGLDALRASCVACHAGPTALAGTRTPHPERASCQQCHVRVLSKEAWSRE